MLYLNQISGERISDPVQQVLPQQTISQLLTPARFDFGVRRNELIPYNYAAGDLILCRRDGEKWVRWYGAVRMLTLSISDEAFQHVTGDHSGGVPSLMEPAYWKILQCKHYSRLFTQNELRGLFRARFSSIRWRRL
jgi:hypothetical protein